MSTSSPGTPDPAYHAGMRQLQDRCDTRRLADRLDEKLSRTAFTAEDRAFIESRPLFFLATADASGRPGLLVQGRRARLRPGDDDDELAFPELRRQRHVPQPRQRPRQPARWPCCSSTSSGPTACASTARARVVDDDPLLASFPGAQFIVRVRAARIFPNCPRYIHRMTVAETSPYVPRADYTPPIPKWKRFDDFADVLARDDPARRTPG